MFCRFYHSEIIDSPKNSVTIELIEGAKCLNAFQAQKNKII
jgi:hypothetical protein